MVHAITFKVKGSRLKRETKVKNTGLFFYVVARFREIDGLTKVPIKGKLI